MNIPADRKMTVLHASPWQLYRSAVKLALEKRENIEFIGEAATGKELLELLDVTIPLIIIMDIRLPSGFEVLEKVKRDFPEVRVMILTLLDDPSIIIKSLELGVFGYLTLDAGSGDIYDAIISCLKNQVYLSVGARQSLGRSFNYLSAAEIKILDLLAENKSDELIAWKMDLSARTVRAIIEKLQYLSGTTSEGELIALATKKGFIEPVRVFQNRPKKVRFWEVLGLFK